MKNLTNYFLQRQFYLFQDIPKLDLNNLSLLNQNGGKDNKKRWDKLHHNGPMFPDEYIPHKIPIIYKNEKIILPSEVEEFATIYSKYIDTEYIKNKKALTCEENYGVKNSFNSPKIREKIKQSFLNKYGVYNPLKSEIVKKTIR
jgi:hypothetical protein